MLKYNGNECKSHTFTTPTQDTSKRNSNFAKSHDQPFTKGVDLFESSFKRVKPDLNGISPKVFSKDKTKIEYPKNLLPTKGISNKLDEVYIEDRFSKTYSQPLMCYGDNKVIDSPYREGARNLRYASPNYVSNAVFYDQTSNLSIDKEEMYKTTSQRYFTPQRNRSNRNDSLDKVKNFGFYSPSRHKMGNVKFDNEPKKSIIATKYGYCNKGKQKNIADNTVFLKINGILIQKLHGRKSTKNQKNFSNIPCLSKTENDYNDSSKAFAQNNENSQIISPHKLDSSQCLPVGKPPIYTSPNHFK